MRKSERIRQLELQVVRLELNIEIINSALQILLDKEGSGINLEAGKWYTKNN
jgi:hypothetical protein